MSNPTTTASSQELTAKKSTKDATQLGNGSSVHRGTGGRGETKKLATATLP